jgi:sRNA-binding carbon storage regulator CsrA
MEGKFMLVLSRRNLESLLIKMPLLDADGKQKVDGNNKKLWKVAKVQIVGTGKLVRLGIQADPDVIILRQELEDREVKQEETSEAAK